MLWMQAPHEYGAVHFHDDDLADAGWAADATLTVPADWRSGFYALRLTARLHGEEVESFVAFFVSAAPGQPKARVAYVASTATFLAYANQALRHDQMHMESMLEKLIVLSADDVYLQEHPEVGLSTYDRHSDGSGACYSNANRPILNMRPAGMAFGYGNDSLVTDWLEGRGTDYDVISDEHIHLHGAALLAPYRCVVTGSHPEYFSREMLNAFEQYQDQGGRHMYLGGNGFYWRSAWHPTKRGHFEVRRGVTGVRTWEGEAGENGLSYSPEPSGLWRSNGRAPQRLVGVGFCAQVYTRGSPYRALPDAHKPEAAWVFAGVDLAQPIGDFGLRGGGAAGIEGRPCRIHAGLARQAAAPGHGRPVGHRWPAVDGGIRLHPPRAERRPVEPGARRPGAVRHARRRAGVLDRLDRLVVRAAAQRLRQQHRAHHRQCAGPLSATLKSKDFSFMTVSAANPIQYLNPEGLPTPSGHFSQLAVIDVEGHAEARLPRGPVGRAGLRCGLHRPRAGSPGPLGQRRDRADGRRPAAQRYRSRSRSMWCRGTAALPLAEARTAKLGEVRPASTLVYVAALARPTYHYEVDVVAAG